jgi:hypothetical protein
VTKEGLEESGHQVSVIVSASARDEHSTFAIEKRDVDHVLKPSSMGPLDQYLMADRNAEIALARSAAPDAISGDAEFLQENRDGISRANEGWDHRGHKAAFEKGELQPLEPAAMSYMMSKGAHLTDDDQNVAHLMFYAPALDGKAWGADLPKSPVMLNPQFKGAEPIDVFIVSVGRWSDGSAAPVM